MQAIDQEKREELLTKIAALLQKTEENGCTEGEALAAGSKAQELMDKYGLSLSDLKAASPADACGVNEIVFAGKRKSHEVQFTCMAIAEFTGTKVWASDHDGQGWRMKFFGLHNDVSIATYLFQTFKAAMDYEWTHYWSTQGALHSENVRNVRKNFMLGMAHRLNDRLRAEHKKAETAGNDCKAIVVVKEALVAQAFKEKFSFRLRSRTSRHCLQSNGKAYQAGESAGSRVSFNKQLD
jgi:hypothetical protein